MNNNQPLRKKRRVRLTIAYIYLLTWVIGTLLFTTLLGHPFLLLPWLVIYPPLGIIPWVVLLIPSIRNMYTEEKLAAIMVLCPLLFVIGVFTWIYYITNSAAGA
ncbi:hypothetical protein [Paenibacillus periandrae]|uniref:hypothetical protein n=1 Tax=Paenibacillus periandrae TaxID=1761741 RepID=UPI001F09B6C7|nr:hypothetical protein [Paenibacillus periandrae]